MPAEPTQPTSPAAGLDRDAQPVPVVALTSDTTPGAPDSEAPPGRCKHCRKPLPAPAGPGRPREYCPPERGVGGKVLKDCKEAARRSRESAVGASVEQPLQAVIAWTDQEQADRRAHATRLRAAADRDTALADQLAELRTTVLSRNTELETETTQARDAASRASTDRDTAQRREQEALSEAADARDAAEQSAERARLAEDASAAHKLARTKAEDETRLAVKSGDEARTALSGTMRRLGEVEDELSRVRTKLDDRITRLETAVADLAAARQALTQKDAAIADLARRLDGTEQELESARQKAAEEVRAAGEAAAQRVAEADVQLQSATKAAAQLRDERDTARTDLIATQAAHRAELRALERERDTARAAETQQRERAVRAEEIRTTVETALATAQAELDNLRPPPAE